MPGVRPATPTISEVYAAFDAASHRVFRSAMARSRGGVVRVDDLLAALVEHEPGLVERLGPGCAIWAAGRFGAGGERAVPMANEPTLRQLLFTALELAQAEVSARPCITPGFLAAAAVAARPVPAWPCIIPGPLPVVQSPRPLDGPDPSADALVDEILEQWLALQTAPEGDPRRHARASLAALLGWL